jgi:hypothetical protein
MKTGKLIYKEIPGSMGELDSVLIDGVEQPFEPIGLFPSRDWVKRLGWSFSHSEKPDTGFVNVYDIPETDLERLQLALKNYDFWWCMSDDMRVWNSGKAEEIRIEQLIKLTGAEGQAMWDEYSDRKTGRLK